MLICYLLLNYFIIPQSLFSQVGINETGSPPNPSSILDISSDSKGLLIPRMTETDKNGIVSPAHSMLIYQTDAKPGFYFNNGTPAAPIWTLLGGDCEGRIPIESLPYTISSSGSYYLTESLTQVGTDNGITISTSDVTLDLNGNSLMGSPSGPTNAIIIDGVRSRINIINGIIKDWNNGILGTSCNNSSLNNLLISDNQGEGARLNNSISVFNCQFENNGSDGLDIGDFGMVYDCNSSNNSFDGIETGDESIVKNCVASGNNGSGYNLGNNINIIDCLASSNGSKGISTGTGSIVNSCNAIANSGNGFELKSGTIAYKNNSKSNGNHGFELDSDVQITNNTADSNDSSGFYTSFSDGKIKDNHSTDNGQHGFFIDGSGNVITNNTASGNSASNYSIGISNTAGTIINSGTINTNDNPYANIEF